MSENIFTYSSYGIVFAIGFTILIWALTGLLYKIRIYYLSLFIIGSVILYISIMVGIQEAVASNFEN